MDAPADAVRLLCKLVIHCLLTQAVVRVFL